MDDHAYDDGDLASTPPAAKSISRANRNWLLIVGNILFVLTFVPLAMMFHAAFLSTEDDAALKVVRYSLAAVSLATLSGILVGIDRYRTLRAKARP